MIVQIKVRDYNGKFVNAPPGDIARASLENCLSIGGGPDSWWWLRDWLCRVLIRKAEENQGNPTVADKWYERYRALRSIG